MKIKTPVKGESEVEVGSPGRKMVLVTSVRVMSSVSPLDVQRLSYTHPDR